MNKVNKWVKNNSVLVVLLVVVTISFGFVLASSVNTKTEANSNKSSDQREVERTSSNLDDSIEKSVTATLKYYYVVNSQYPFNKEELKEFYDDSNKEGISFSDLEKNAIIDYKVRGDREAYEYSFKEYDGDTRIVKGNYKEDYE